MFDFNRSEQTEENYGIPLNAPPSTKKRLKEWEDKFSYAHVETLIFEKYLRDWDNAISSSTTQPQYSKDTTDSKEMQKVRKGLLDLSRNFYPGSYVGPPEFKDRARIIAEKTKAMKERLRKIQEYIWQHTYQKAIGFFDTGPRLHDGWSRNREGAAWNEAVLV